MWWLVIIAVVTYLLYIGIVKPLGYWKDRNVTYSEPWPIVGNMGQFFLRKKSFVEICKQLYHEFPNERYNGLFFFTDPQLQIRDLDLIKQITIKDFDSFVDRSARITSKVDFILAKNLAALTGEQWRDMRATLSPSFTSSKMKFLFKLLTECAEQFTKYFEGQGSRLINVEMKDIASRFTNDAIATAAFGVTVDSLDNKNNEFFLMGKDATDLGGLRALKFLMFTICPKLMELLNIPIFPTALSSFFKRMVSETIEVREKYGVIRPDMIHLLLEARRGQLTNDEEPSEATVSNFAVVEESHVGRNKHQQKVSLTDDDITAQALVFFFAGFDTTSTLISFMSHELAVNPQIQKRLQEEIDETLKKCNGKISYEALLGMKYLDMVVSESLRKWPPGVALTRVCVKDYVIPPKTPNEKPFTITKDMKINIPLVAIHHDPELFPNPEKFDPERFNDENKSNIVPNSYMPFGIGPRACIASRFALMETKVLFFHLLSKFDIVPTEKTPIPLEITKKKLVLAPDGGFWLGFKQRIRI